MRQRRRRTSKADPQTGRACRARPVCTPSRTLYFNETRWPQVVQRIVLAAAQRVAARIACFEALLRFDFRQRRRDHAAIDHPATALQRQRKAIARGTAVEAAESVT